MRASRGVTIALTSVAVVALGACAQPSSPGSAPDETGATATREPTTAPSTPSVTAPTEPTLPVPSGAPTVPTDPSPKNRVAGGISHVGSGPCYTVTNDEGITYALVGGTGPTLSVGTWVVVTFGPAPASPVSCPGIPVTIIKIEVIS